MDAFRICRKCGIKDELKFFVIDKNKKHGRANICKKCRNKTALIRKQNHDFDAYIKEHKDGYFLKKCPVHGGLDYENILLVHRKTRGKYYPTLICVLCELIWRSEAYNEERYQERLKKAKPLKCVGCNKIKALSDYSVSQLKTRSNTCRDCRKKRQDKYYQENSISNDFYMTRPMYNEMLNSQGNVCKICKNKETAKFRKKVRRLSVDHCHKTGKIRGILCHGCNHGLGSFRDNPQYIRDAAIYLEEND